MVSPEDLAARVLVLEKACERNEDDISQLWQKVGALEACTSSWSEIKEDIKSIKNELTSLKITMTAQKAKESGESSIKLSIREWSLVGLTGLGILITYLAMRPR